MLGIRKLRNQPSTFPVNQAVKGIFMNTSSKMMRNYAVVLNNHQVRKIQTIVETERAPLNNLTCRDSQVFGMRLVLAWRDTSRKHISLLSEKVGKLPKTTVCAFTDSVLCLGGRCREDPGSMKAWETHLEYFVQSKEYREFEDLTGLPVQFHWRTYPGHTTTKILQEIKKLMAEKISPHWRFQKRIIFLSMFDEIEWWSSQHESKCSRNAVEVANYARNCVHYRWSFLGPGNEEKWFGTRSHKAKEKWNDIAYKMIK